MITGGFWSFSCQLPNPHYCPFIYCNLLNSVQLKLLLLLLRSKLRWINYFWTCLFHYINIFCKKLEYEIKPNFSKYKIRPPHAIFSAFLKKITTTGSSANFVSPKPNGQGYDNFLDPASNPGPISTKAVC